MRLLDYERASWLYCLLAALQGTEAHLLHTAGKKNDIICLQETHEKDEFCKLFRFLFPQFRLFGTFTLNNVKCRRSAMFVHKKLPQDGAVSLIRPPAKDVITE